jgi:hypothetical protein
VRFTDFLRTTVLLSAGAASALAAVTVAGGAGRSANLLVPVAGGWWLIAAMIGGWLGRRADTSPPIATLLASARTQPTLPELNPGRTLLNRLWPLLLSTLGAGAVAFVAPQVPAVAAGFAIIWALAWRRQSSAVTAIEERDGVRFYVEPTSPLKPIRLVRTPGFRSNLYELNGSTRPRQPARSHALLRVASMSSSFRSGPPAAGGRRGPPPRASSPGDRARRRGVAWSSSPDRCPGCGPSRSPTSSRRSRRGGRRAAASPRISPARSSTARSRRRCCGRSPGAIWLDSMARENRPGRHGVWQRSSSAAAWPQAPLVMPMSIGALAPAARAATRGPWSCPSRSSRPARC